MNVLRHHHRLVAVSTACAALVTAIGLVLTGTAGRTHATERALQLPSKQIAFLQDGLGPTTPHGRVDALRRTTPGLAVRIEHQALSVGSVAIPGHKVSISSVGDGTRPWHAHAFGASRNTPFGTESIVVNSSVAEQLLTVQRHYATKTWRWNLDTNLRPRLLSDGSVGFVPKHPGRISDLVIAPVAIFDANGKTITPHGARWQISGTSAHPTLDLQLNDANLPLPYVIDPAIHGTPSAAGALASQSSVTITKPASAASGDLLFAAISISAPTATTTVVVHTGGVPWTLVRKTLSTTNVALFTFYRIAGSSEPASYQFDIQDPAGTPATKTSSGGIAAYTGVYNGTPLDAVADANSNGTAGTSPQVSGITTSGQNRLMIYAVADTTATISTQPYINGPALMTSRWNVAGSGMADMVETNRLTNAATTFTALSVSNQWAAQVVSFVSSDATPSFRSTTQSNNNNTATATVTLAPPAGLSDGDVMVAGINVLAVNANLSLVAPSGWTLIEKTANSSGETLFTYYKVANGESGNYVWTSQISGVDTSEKQNGGMEAYSGMATSGTLDTSGTAPGYFEATSAGASNSSASVTGIGTAGTNRMSIFMVGTGAARDINTAPTLNGVAMTTRANVNRTPGFGSADAHEGSSFSGQTATATLSGSTTWAAQVISLVEDKTAPAQTLSVTEGTNPAYQYFNSTNNTIYYNTAVGGDFTITSTPSDPGGTLDWVSFPDISVTGFTGQGISDGASPYSSGTYSWTSSNATAPTGAQVSAFDTAGNHGDTALSLVRDVTAGTTTVQFPANNGSYNAAGFDGGSAGCAGAPASSICGTMSDATSGISQVQLSIQKDGGNYWNGTSFGSGSEVFQTATLTSSNTRFNYPFDSTKLTNGSTYTIHIKSTDNVSNVESQQTVAFTHDTSAPSSASLSSNGIYNAAGWPGAVTGTVSDSGTGGNGISAVKVSIQKDGGASACWNGSAFTASCPNWVSVTSGGTATGSANANWSYTLASSALTNGSTYSVSVQATDATTSGTTSGTLSTNSFSYDTSAPSAATLSSNGTYNTAGWPGALTGTASDSGTGGHGISAVNVSIQKDGGASACWTGSAFTASCPNWVSVTSGGTATGSANANWSYTLASSALSNGSTYGVSVQATDATTNGTQSGTLSTSSFSYDTSAPNTATLTTNGNYNTAGWPGAVTGTVSDSGTGGNGISTVKVSIQKDGGASACWNGSAFTASCPNWVSVTSGGTATGSANANWSYTLASSALTNGSTYSVSVQATDATTSGTTSGTLSTNSFSYDTSPPSHSISLNSASGAFYSSGTLYYKGDAAGSFTVNDAFTDSFSGPASVTYPAIGTGGWTHNAETVNSGPNYTSSAYSWAQNPGGNPSGYQISGADVAGNTSTSGLTFTNDVTGPSVTAPSVNGAYYTSLSVPVTMNTGSASDGGAGVDASTGILQREWATLSGGSCTGWGGTWTNVTLVGGNDTGVANGRCYRYRELLSDRVGNQGSSSSSSIAMIDNNAPGNSLSLSSVSPAGSAYKNGSNVYYRGVDSGGGSFKVTNAVSDSESGPASSQTAGLGGTSTGWSHTPSTVSTPAGGPYESNAFSWTQGTTSSPTEVVTGRDSAGNATAAGALTFTDDSNAPTGGALTVNGTMATGGGSSSYDDDGSFTIGTRTDYAETQSASESGLASSTLVRTSASYASANVCGAFGSSTTISGNPDQTGLTTGCYRYTLTGTDNVGNTISIQTTVKVDTSDPTLSLSFANLTGATARNANRIYFRPDAAGGGSFDITGTGSDSDTDIAGYTFPVGSALGTNWSGSGSGATRTYSYTATATTNGSQSVSTTNNAGRSGSAGFDLTADSTAPTGGALTVNGTASSGAGSSSYDTDGNFTIGTRTDYAETQSATESGLASSTLVRTSASYSSPNVCGAFGSATTIVGSPDQTSLATGCYRYTLTGTDNVGNAVSIYTTVKVDTSDPSAPSLSFAGLGGGAYYPGSGTRVYFRPGAANGTFDITADSSDGDSDIASYSFPAGSALGTNWSGSGTGATRTYSYTATATTNGSRSVTATNNAGRTNSSSFDLTDDSTAPTGGALTVNGTAASGGTGSSYDSDGDFTIGSRSDYSETQSATESGLASSTLVRSSASYSAPNVCGAFGSATTISGNPDQTSLATGCYRYTLTGTDNVGNTVSIQTTVKVDTSNPTVPVLSFTNLVGNVSVVGTTVYFLPTGSGSFDVTASATDADTDISQYTFPSAASFGSGWSVSGSGAARTYSFTSGAATPGTQTVTATNGVGRTASSDFDVVVSDTTPPTTTIQCNGAACQGTYYTSSPVSATLSADDGPEGSGVQVIRYTIDGSNPTPVNGSDYVAPIDITTTTTVKFRAYDNLGNEEAVGSQVILLDGTPPNVSLTLNENPASGAQYVSGTTLFYRPGAAGGTFRVTAASDDPQTGVTSVDFPSIANVTGGSSQTSSPYREDYTWSASTTDAASHNVVATNGAGATTSVPLTLTQDSAAPTGQSITLTGANAPYYGSASVGFSLGDGNDGSGSGLDTSSRTVTRESAPLTGDSCGSFTPDGGTYSSPDTAVANGNCYRYSFTINDNVGNVSSSVTATAKVDTQAPTVSLSAPTELTGAGDQYYDGASKTEFFRPAGSGSFRLNATASDSETAVTSVSFPNISGLSGWSGSTGGNDTTSPYNSPADYTWSAGAAEPGARSISGSDKAANNNSDTITLTADPAAPTGQAITLTGANAPYYGAASVTFSLGDGSDPAGGSGLDTATRSVTRETGDLVAGVCSNFSADGGTFTSPDTSVSTGHCYRYTFTIADHVGNTSIAVNATAKVDTDAPSVSVNAPTELTGTGNQYYDAGSQTLFFRPGGSGSFSLNATASDGQSGVSQVGFPDVAAVSGWTGSTGGADNSSPYSSPTDYSWSSGASAPGVRSITATNNAAIDGVATITLSGDSTAPSGQTLTLTGANAPYYGSASVGFSLGDGNDGSGSGLDNSSRTVTRESATLNGDSCGSFNSDAGTYTSPDTAVSTGHCYRYSFTISDTVGNTSTAVTATAKIDTQAPGVSANAPTELTGNGNQYYDAGSKTQFFRSTGSGSFRLNATASDSETDIASVGFPDISGLSGWSGSNGGSDPSNPYSSPTDYSWSAGAADPGARTITATDKASNNGTDSITIKDDTTGPTGQAITLTGALAPYYAANSVTFNLTNGSDDSGGAGLDTSSATVTRETATLGGDSCTSFTADAGTFTSPDTAVSSGHCYRYTFTISDNVGNTSATVTATAKVDTDDPSVSLTDPGTPVGGTVALAATASDPSTAVQQVVFERAPAGGSTWTTIGTDTTSPYTASWNTTSLADGLYDVRAVATDTTNNTSTSVVSNRRVDNTAPDTTIDSSPADPSNNTTPSFTFSSSESGSTFECSIDGGGWTSCTSPESISPALGAGSHTFQARATDGAGNTDATPASYTWTVDLTAPNTTIDSQPADPSNDSTPSFSFSSSESGSTFECRVDGGSWTPCTSPDTISPALAGGSHTFQVRATDAAGNTDATPASFTWVVDLSAPNTTIDSQPADASNDTTPNFTFSSSESGSTFGCRLDGSGWASCTSPDTISPALGAGSHTFQVRATDSAGNTDATPASYTWTVDLAAPSTSIDTHPADPSNNTTPSFTFSSSESGSTFECSIDGGGWTSCTSPDTISPALGAGSHTFQARATDGAGNTDATPASYTWTVDLTAPNTTIDSSPSSPSANTTPTFAFSSSESGSSFECRIDGSAWASCTSPDTISPALAEGSHTFDVRAIDAAGNADGTPASDTWLIDTGAPTVTITDPTTYLNGSDPNNYTVTASTPDGDVTNVDFFECSDASTGCATGSWIQFGTDNSSPYSATWSTPAFDGAKAIRALAVDAASNTGQNVRTITIDRTAPTGVTVTYPNGYVTGSYTITTSNGSDSDVNASTASLERQAGDLANDACSSYGSWTAATSPDTLASGKCARYRYSVADIVGNIAVATSANEAKSDTGAPTSSLTDPGANLRQTITLSASASDTGGSDVNSVAFQRRPAGGGSWTTIGTDGTSPYSVSFDTTSVADGLYDLRSVATDTAGNDEAALAVVANRRIDNTAPSATMLSPGNPVGGPVTLTSTTSDTGGSGIATVAYELAPNGGSFNSQSPVWDTTLVSDGLYDLRVFATDVAGNTQTSSVVTIRVDNTPPALTFSTPAGGTVVSGTVNLVGSASDASPASPPVTFAYKLHGDPPSAYAATGAAWNTATLPGGDGLYDLRARATDDANNTAAVENTSIRVDNAPPTVSITAPAAAINGSLPSPTTFAADANDPGGSGVTQLQFFECSDQSSNCATGIWNPLGTVLAPGPYSVSWSIPAADGIHALAAVATDNAGHPATAILNVDVDRTAPSTTILTKPSDPSNVAAPAFTFDSTEPGSTFECSIDGGAFAACTSPHDIAGLTDNDHTFNVRATDAAGNTDATPATWTWHRDTNDPTGTLNNPGANIRQTVTLTSTETDPPANGYASGLQSVTYEYSANGTTWAPIGTLNSAPFDTILWNTSGVADGVYQLRLVVRDVAGNATTSATVANVRIDNTAPTTSQNDPGPYLRATKTLTGSAADSGSGIDHVDFQRAPAGSGSWTTIATDSTPADGFQAVFDTTSVSDGHYDLQTVAYDVAGNQAAATPVTDRLVDNTVPSATINNPGAYLRGAVNLTSSTGDPGGANASGVVTVEYEYSTNGGGTWQSTGANFNSAAVPDGNVSLHVVATDAAGNTTTSAPITSLADNTKPATTDNAPSGWQSSPVTVTLTANDGGSGVNVTEYSVDGNPTYTTGTSVSIPAPADGSNDGAHTIAYFSADNAGNIETIKSATVLIDATPPACPSCSAADYLRGTVTLSADPGSGGSGIKSVAFEYTDAGGSTWTPIGTDTTGPGPYTADWDTTLVADGHYDLRIQITDNADNVTTTNLPDKVVDNTAPDVALVGAPTEGQLVSGTISIAASASDVTSPIASVTFFVQGGLLATDTGAPFTQSWNTTTGSDGAATIQVVVEDMAGNTATSPVRNVTVDNVDPTPTLADPGSNLNGTVSLTASSDPDTAQVDFERRPGGGGSWVTIASDTTTPWGTSLDTTALTDGLYDFRAVATDQTGHTGTSPIRANVRIDNTSPAGSLTGPANGATVGGPSVALSGSYSDGGSGVASVRYELRPTGGGSWATIATSTSAPFSASWDATTVSSGSYDLQPVITDGAGNTFTGTLRTITVDVSAPTVVLTNPGATISGSVILDATVSGSGATQVVFAATPAGGASWSSFGTDTSAPWSTTFDTLQLQDGVYDLRATVSDNLGNTSSDVVAAIRIDNTVPRVVSSTPGEGTTVPSADAIGLVTSENATPVGVTLDGNATVAPVVSGTHIDYGTGTLGPGLHTLAGELQDSSGKKAPFRIHFTVWTASSSVAPTVDKNTAVGSPTTVESADGWASATMPAGNWSSSTGDWLILRITPTAAPAGLTNGFGAGPITVDVTARWALAGTEVHEFNQAIGILMRSTEKGLVPATFENGHWRVISRVPSAGTLPTGWEDGFYTDGAGFHVLTKHLSLFALLRDLEVPNPPQNVRGYLGPTGLTLRWTPGTDNSGTYDFVTVFSDSTDAGHFGVDYTAASVGAWSPGDPRIFRLKETDLAGNESSLTQVLRQVPSLIGKTPDQAAALLAPLGLKLGTTTIGGTGPAGTITGPAGLVLAQEGTAIDVTVSPGGGLTRLVLKVTTAPRVKPAVRKNIAARISLTRASNVTAELFSPRRVKLYTWRFSLKAGRSIVRLRLPHQVRRSGVYTMRWTARSGRESISHKITIRLVGAHNVIAVPARVLLAGPAAGGIRGTFTTQKPKLITASGIEPTFDAAASRRTDVRVIVVDVDAFGVSLIRDLHAVFPSTKIVALTSGPKQMAASLKAGAAIALPRSTPASTLGRLIQRLLAKPPKPVKTVKLAGPPHQNAGHLH